MLRGITSARYTMKATILRPHSVNPDPVDPEATGEWVGQQDPLTGEMVRVWKPVTIDNPDTVHNEVNVVEIVCMARGIVDGGIRASATTESFDDIYRNVDIINLWLPKRYTLTKRDRVTNIRTKNNVVLWRDEEDEGAGLEKATVFNVNGVIPVLDPFSRHIDNFCLLERVEV